MKRDRRGSWYLLTGVVLGVTLGLVYSWVISPVEYVDAPPYALRSDYKDEYRALVAAAYLYSGDLVRAQDRLDQLKDYDSAQSLAVQAQRALADGHPKTEVRALSLLAMALGQGLTSTPSLEQLTQTEVVMPTSPALTFTPLLDQPQTIPNSSPIASSTLPTSMSTVQPTKTIVPTPTQTPVPIQAAPFAVQSTELICNPNQPDPLIQAVIQDASGTPVPSVELIVSSDQGEDHFYTGLKPELGPGYADFLMQPGVTYTLRLADSGVTVNNLMAKECILADGNHYWGSWLVTFGQP